VVSGIDKKEVSAEAVISPVSADSLILQLKAAKKEGRLSEVLLDRRAKLKRSVDCDISFQVLVLT